MKLTKNDISNTINVFQNYGKNVVRYAKTILSQKRKNTKTKQLYNSIDYLVEFSDSEVSVGIEIKSPADEYWAYVESGVHGSEQTGTKKWTSSERQVGKNSDMFDFPKQGFRFKGKNIAEGVVKSWIQNKPLKIRELKGSSKGGQFKKKSNKNINSASFLIGRAIATRGLPWTGFLSQPILTQNQNLTNELLEAFGVDIMKKLDFTLNAK